MLHPIQYLFIVLGGFAAGAVNALAGGGTLITFPILTAIGIPPVIANITSTVSLFPGYFGAAIAQLPDVMGQRNRLAAFIPAAALGGLTGGLLLFLSDEKFFIRLVPFLILFAVILLALSEPLRLRLARAESAAKRSEPRLILITPLIYLATIYGGYFGAGLSVIILAILALTIDDSLTRLNALKQFIAFAANTMAAALFLFSGRVMWGVAALMAASALLGGLAGGKLASWVNSAVLRWTVVSIGLIVALIFFVQYYFST